MSHDRGCYMCYEDRGHANSCREPKCPYKEVTEELNDMAKNVNLKVLKHRDNPLRIFDADYKWSPPEMTKKEAVDHPSHYGGKDNPYEAIKVIEAWNLGFNLGNTVKYISRAGKKDALVQDLEKAKWYLEREIANLKHNGDKK